MHDVLLGEGDSAMRLDRIAVVPDLAGSLWARSWRLSSLEFSGVHVSVLESEDGKWQVRACQSATMRRRPIRRKYSRRSSIFVARVARQPDHPGALR